MSTVCEQPTRRAQPATNGGRRPQAAIDPAKAGGSIASFGNCYDFNEAMVCGRLANPSNQAIYCKEGRPR